MFISSGNTKKDTPLSELQPQRKFQHETFELFKIVFEYFY